MAESTLTPDGILLHGIRLHESPAERRRIVRALAEALDTHDVEHTGAWGNPDDDGCPFC